MGNTEQTEADGYYGEEEVNEDELDLSFLDDEDQPTTFETTISKINTDNAFERMPDKNLAKAIISLRRKESSLTDKTREVLQQMTVEYISRGKLAYLFTPGSELDKDTQKWLWGKVKNSFPTKIEGYRVNTLTNVLEVDTESDFAGSSFLLNRRQLVRTDDFYAPVLRRSKAHAMVKEKDQYEPREVQLYTPTSATAREKKEV